MRLLEVDSYGLINLFKDYLILQNAMYCQRETIYGYNQELRCDNSEKCRLVVEI